MDSRLKDARSAPIRATRCVVRASTSCRLAPASGLARREGELSCRLRPDLEIIPIRGNVPPRLAKMRSARLDSVVLAMAGLERLGLLDEVAEVLGVEESAIARTRGSRHSDQRR